MDAQCRSFFLRMLVIFLFFSVFANIFSACKPRQKNQLSSNPDETINICTKYDEQLEAILNKDFGSGPRTAQDTDAVQMIKANSCVDTILTAQLGRKGTINSATRKYLTESILPTVKKNNFKRDAQILQENIGMVFFLDELMRVKPEQKVAINEEATREAIDILLGRKDYSSPKNPLLCRSIVSCLMFADQLAKLSEQGDLIYESNAQSFFREIVDTYKSAVIEMVKAKSLSTNDSVQKILTHLADTAWERARFRSLLLPLQEGRNIRFSPDAKPIVEESIRSIVRLSNISDQGWMNAKNPLNITPEVKKLLEGCIEAELKAVNPINLTPISTLDKVSFSMPSDYEIEEQKNKLIGLVVMNHINLIVDQIWYQRIVLSYEEWEKGIREQLVRRNDQAQNPPYLVLANPNVVGSRFLAATYIWLAMSRMFANQVLLPNREKYTALLETVSRWTKPELSANASGPIIITQYTLDFETAAAKTKLGAIKFMIQNRLKELLRDDVQARVLYDRENELAKGYIDFESWFNFFPRMIIAYNNLIKIQQNRSNDLEWVNLASYQLTSTERNQMYALSQKGTREKAQDNLVPFVQLQCLRRYQLQDRGGEDSTSFLNEWGLTGSPQCPFDFAARLNDSEKMKLICDTKSIPLGKASFSNVNSQANNVLTEERLNLNCLDLSSKVNQTLIETIPQVVAMVYSAGAGMALSNAITSRILAGFAVRGAQEGTAKGVASFIANQFAAAVVFDVVFGLAYQGAGLGGKVFDVEKSIGQNFVDVSLRLAATTINFSGLHGLNVTFDKAAKLATAVKSQAWLKTVYMTHFLTETAYFTYLPPVLDAQSEMIKSFVEGERIEVRKVFKEMEARSLSSDSIMYLHLQHLAHSALVVAGFRLHAHFSQNKKTEPKEEPELPPTEKQPSIEEKPPVEKAPPVVVDAVPPPAENMSTEQPRLQDAPVESIPDSSGKPLSPGEHRNYEIKISSEDGEGAVIFGTSLDFTEISYARAELKKRTGDDLQANASFDPYVLLGVSPAELATWKKGNISAEVARKILKGREAISLESWDPFLSSEDGGTRDFALFVKRYIEQTNPAEKLARNYEEMTTERFDQSLLNQIILNTAM